MPKAALCVIAALVLGGCFSAAQSSSTTSTPATAALAGDPMAGLTDPTIRVVDGRVYRTLSFDYDGRTPAYASAGAYPVGGPALPRLASGYNSDFGFWTTAKILYINATVSWEARSELTRELRLHIHADEPNDLYARGQSPLRVEWRVGDLEAEVFRLGVAVSTQVDGVVGGASLLHEQDFHVNGTLFVEEQKPLPLPAAVEATPLEFKGTTEHGICGHTPPCHTFERGDVHAVDATGQPVELRGTLRRTGDRHPCVLRLTLWDGQDSTTYFPHAEGEDKVPFLFDLRGYAANTSFTILTSCTDRHDSPVGPDPDFPQEYVLEATLVQTP